VQPAGFAEDAAGFAGVANERGDRIAAGEYAADDLAADAAGGADHCGGHRVSFRQSSISSAANRTCSRRPCSAAVSQPPSGYLVTGITPPGGRDQACNLRN
jgi:hypothetical protein